MTNRDDIRDQFSPLLDGELSPEERARVEAALSGDAELLRELDAMKRVDDLYRALPAESAPDGFEHAVRDRLRQPRAVVAPAAPRRAALRRYWTAGLAAAAVVVVGAGVVMFNADRAAPGRFALSKNVAATQLSAAPTSAMQADRAAPAAESAASSEKPVEKFFQSAPAESKIEASRVERERAAEPAMPALRAQKEADRGDMAQAAPERPVLNEGVKAARGPASPAKELPMVGGAAGKLERDEAAPRQETTDSLSALGYAGKTMADEERAAGVEGADVGMAIAPTAAADTAPATPPPTVQAPAIAPSPAPASAAPASPPASTEGGAAEKMKKANAPKDAVANGIVDTRTVGARLFTLRDGVWYESGYTDQKVTVLERGSAAAHEVLGKDAELEGLLSLDRPAVFRIDDDWYRLVAPKP